MSALRRGAIQRVMPLKRTAFVGQRKPIRRTPMKAGRTAGAKRQAVLRADAYALVDLRSGGQCEAFVAGKRCPSRAIERQHRRPRGMGSTRRATTECPSNLIATCRWHHDAAESKRTIALELGWLVPQRGDPTRAPAYLFCGWVWLTPDGNYSTVTPPSKEN